MALPSDKQFSKSHLATHSQTAQPAQSYTGARSGLAGCADLAAERRANRVEQVKLSSVCSFLL